MIKEIRMKNFKCFSEQTLNFSEFNILAGANAAGKSTVLQAILLTDAASNEKGDVVDAGNAMRIPVGNPQALISQNPIDLDYEDFIIEIGETNQDIVVSYRIDKLSPLKLSFIRSNQSLESHIFYLNAERKGPRMSYPAGYDQDILSDGSNAAYLIDRADMEQRKIPENLRAETSTGKFSAQVEGWMSAILGELSFSVNTDLVKATTDIKYGNNLVDKEVLPTMTGFGVSYVLSVVTAGLWCTTVRNAVLIIENPEAHLHPLAQSRIGKFLQIVSGVGVQIIIETHSEHIIDGARIQAAWLDRTNEMSVKFFDAGKEKVMVEDIHVDRNGELSCWPKGFFDQKGQDLRELLQIRRTNAGKQ